ncbi:MAG: hypothetical protein ABI810_18610 [Sphingomonas bacterium]
MVTARRLVGMLVMLCGFGLASTAQAQQARAGGKANCLPIPLVWLGGLDDVAHISTIPVPKTYRDLYLGDPCTRSRLVTTSLIDWQLTFGNEASTTAALEFLEARTTGGKPAIADLGQRLATARRRAQHDIAATAAILRQPDGSQRGEALLRGSKRLNRLRSMIDTWNGYGFLAYEYLRAAEFYGSHALLARARSFATPALDGFRIVKTLATADVAANLGAASPIKAKDNRDRSYGDLEMRLAIVTASLSRDPKDLATAETVLTSYSVPFYKVAAREAFSHGNYFCAMGKKSDLTDYAKACKSDDFQAKAIAWWRYRAQLDLLDSRASDPLGSVDTAIKLIERDNAWHTASRGMRRYDAAVDQIVALRLASADAFVRSASAELGASGNGDRDSAIRPLVAALNELGLAELLASASQTPGRFRQIATRFLAIRAKLAALEETGRYPALERQAAYFSAVLASLDEIALGRVAKQ